MSDLNGTLCVSVDCHQDGHLAIETAHRGRDLVSVLSRYNVASNWTSSVNESVELPAEGEVTLATPKGLDRGEMIRHLRSQKVHQLLSNQTSRTVVMEPHEAKQFGDILVRHGFVTARPRTAVLTNDTGPRLVRGGLWVVPITCSFVGGSRRSVRALFGACQRRLVEACSSGRVFHLNVDIGNQRNSWSEELKAIQALLETAANQRVKGRLRSIQLSSIPQTVTKKSSKPMVSILRAA